MTLEKIGSLMGECCTVQPKAELLACIKPGSGHIYILQITIFCLTYFLDLKCDIIFEGYALVYLHPLSMV